MTAYNGAATYILLGEETTFNTSVTTDKDLGVLASVDVSESANLQEINSLGDRETCALIEGNYDLTVSLDGTLNSGAVMEMFFGQCTDTETSGDYTHTFVDRGVLDLSNTIKSYTFMANLDGANDYTYTHSGVKCNSLEITVSVNEPIKFTSELIGATTSVGTSIGTKVKTMTEPLTFSHCELLTGDEGSEALIGQVQSFNISFNNNIDANDVRQLGSREVADLIVKNLGCEGEFTVRMNDTSHNQRFLGGTTVQNTVAKTGIIFRANNGIALGSGRVELYIKLLGCKYDELGTTFPEDGVVEQTISFKKGNIDDIYFVDSVDSYF